MLDQLSGIFFSNNPNDWIPYGYLFLDLKPNKSPHSETGAIGDITGNIVEVLYDHSYGEKPDYNLKESNQRGEIF